MKKIFSFLFILMVSFLFCGCGNNEEEDLKQNVKKEKVNYSLSKEDTNKVNESYFKLVKEIYSEGENLIFSPTSLYVALSMLSEGAVDSSSLELLKYLGVNSLDELREINKIIVNNNDYNNDKGIVRLGNSFWFDNSQTKFNKEYVDILNEYYLAEEYSVNLKDVNDIEKIVKWINDKTNDFLNIKKEDFWSEDAAAYLINTIYFNNPWETEFNKDNSYSDTFYGASEKEATFMRHTISSTYYKGEGYISFYDYFENGNKICYVLPDEGENVSDYIDVNPFINQYKIATINLSVPKFKYQQKYKLVDALKNVGVSEVFSGGLDKMGEILYVSDITQIAGIEFSEKGVEAAAVTTVEIVVESSGTLGLYLDIKLNRPFIYYIVDSNDTILFSGVINNLNN